MGISSQAREDLFFVVDLIAHSSGNRQFHSKFSRCINGQVQALFRHHAAKPHCAWPARAGSPHGAIEPIGDDPRWLGQIPGRGSGMAHRGEDSCGLRPTCIHAGADRPLHVLTHRRVNRSEHGQPPTCRKRCRVQGIVVDHVVFTSLHLLLHMSHHPRECCVLALALTRWVGVVGAVVLVPRPIHAREFPFAHVPRRARGRVEIHAVAQLAVGHDHGGAKRLQPSGEGLRDRKACRRNQRDVQLGRGELAVDFLVHLQQVLPLLIPGCHQRHVPVLSQANRGSSSRAGIRHVIHNPGLRGIQLIGVTTTIGDSYGNVQVSAHFQPARVRTPHVGKHNR